MAARDHHAVDATGAAYRFGRIGIEPDLVRAHALADVPESLPKWRAASRASSRAALASGSVLAAARGDARPAA